jgi:hypothetical protein
LNPYCNKCNTAKYFRFTTTSSYYCLASKFIWQGIERERRKEWNLGSGSQKEQTRRQDTNRKWLMWWRVGLLRSNGYGFLPIQAVQLHTINIQEPQQNLASGEFDMEKVTERSVPSLQDKPIIKDSGGWCFHKRIFVFTCSPSFLKPALLHLTQKHNEESEPNSNIPECSPGVKVVSFKV